jgi:RHS repeat-associated protein
VPAALLLDSNSRSRARARGPKTASGIFFRSGETRARKSRRKSLESRRVARPAATTTVSGVRYYGRRYYNPSQGRFVGRDPKQEKGGLHLYAFVRNNPTNLWDYLGMQPAQSASSGFQWELESTDGHGNEVWVEVGSYGTPEVGQKGARITVMAPFAVTPTSAAPELTYQWSRSGSTTSGNSYSGSVVTIVTGDSQMRDALSGFFSGTREVNRVFGANDPWTQDMKNHPHVQNVAAQITELLAGDPQSLIGKPTSANFSLNNQSLTTNISTYVRDGLAGLGLTGAQYSTGSFRLTYTVTGVSDGVATVTFQINDALSFGSFTRLPTTNSSILVLAGGTDPIAGFSLSSNQLTAPASSVNDPMGPFAPFNTVNLQWNWTQQITVPPPTTDRPPGG